MRLVAAGGSDQGEEQVKPEDAKRLEQIRGRPCGCLEKCCTECFLLRVIDERGKELEEAGEEIDRAQSQAEGGELSDLKEAVDIVRHRCRDEGTTLEQITNHLDMIRSGDTCRAECAKCGGPMAFVGKDPA